MRIVALVSALLLIATPSFAAKTVTVGDSGSSCNPCTYATVALAEDGEDGNITSTGPVYIDCYEREETTTGAASDRTSSNTGIYSAERWRINTTLSEGGIVLNIDNTSAINMKIKNLQFKWVNTSTGESTNGIYLGASLAANSVIEISGNIFEIIDVGDHYANAIKQAGTNGVSSLTIYNNIIYRAQIGIYPNNYNTPGSILAYNNTISSKSNGIRSPYDIVLAVNNICIDGTDNFQAGSGGGFNDSSNYNISDVNSDTTGGANDIAAAGQEPAFSNKAGNDYHLASSDTLAQNAGSDLSGTFTTDIDGTTRDDWDIGADEYGSGTSPAVNRTSSTGVTW
jgi:hypothetical protein